MRFYAHDGNGNLTNSLDARGKQILRSYDALIRPTQVSYRDANHRTETTPTITYHYDEDSTNCPVTLSATNGKDRLSCVYDGLGSTTYEYDVMGRTTRLRRAFDSVQTLDAAYAQLPGRGRNYFGNQGMKALVRRRYSS